VQQNVIHSDLDVIHNNMIEFNEAILKLTERRRICLHNFA